jgi:hypothetical protein
MGRDTSSNKTPLLDTDADQNIGNSTVMRPQAGSAGTVVPQILRDRIIQLQGGSGAGQTTTVVMTASRIVGAENPNPGFPGPITGIIEFGNGARSSRVEFDIPVGPFAGHMNTATSALEPQDGGVLITVPTSVIRAYARYDNLLLAPLLGTNPPVSHAQISGVPVIGPGGPLLCMNPLFPLPPVVNIPVQPEPVLVKAMASYFAKSRSKAYKTLNCYLCAQTSVPAPTTITVGTPAASLIAGFPNFAFWTLPAFTKSVTVLRFPHSTGLSVILHDGIRPVNFINIAAGAPAATIELMGSENIIGITSGANPVNMLKIVCEIGV